MIPVFMCRSKRKVKRFWSQRKTLHRKLCWWPPPFSGCRSFPGRIVNPASPFSPSFWRLLKSQGGLIAAEITIKGKSLVVSNYCQPLSPLRPVVATAKRKSPLCDYRYQAGSQPACHLASKVVDILISFHTGAMDVVLALVITSGTKGAQSQPHSNLMWGLPKWPKSRLQDQRDTSTCIEKLEISVNNSVVLKMPPFLHNRYRCHWISMSSKCRYKWIVSVMKEGTWSKCYT